MKRNTAVLLLVSVLHSAAADETAAPQQTFRATHSKAGVTVAGMEVALPSGTSWWLAPAPEGAPVAQLVMQNAEWETKAGKPPLTVVMGLVRGAGGKVTLRFESTPPGRICTVEWDTSRGEASAGLPGEWAQARSHRYAALLAPPGSLPERWARESAAIFGGEEAPQFARDSFAAAPPDADPMDTLAVFGGRCAVQETLQLQDIGDERRGGSGEKPKYTRPVPVSELQGVKVKSHPFAELAKQNATQPPPLELAAFCPPDRFFAFCPQPRRMRTVITQLSLASGQLSSPVADGATDYRLWQKYLARLGLKEETVRAWLDGGHAEAVAVTLPDLFLRDGTDITFLIRMKEGQAPPLFSVMPETGTVITIPGSGECHVARRGQVLIASTSRAEAEMALKLADTSGRGSLGESDELRCMRQRLPDSASTVAWCYFSDGFIRRLTGPAVKIGQFRRLQARSALESLTASALIYRLDHGEDAADTAALIRTGYAWGFKSGRDRWSARERMNEAEVTSRFKDVTLQSYTATSGTWGTLGSLKPLSVQPVTTVTALEANLYAAYVARYEDFWRQYFDPIAMRLDETAPGTWSLSTLVLPLVDNSLYAGLKEALEPARKAVLPQLDSTPVLAMGFALKEGRLESAMLMPFSPGTAFTSGGFTGRCALAVPDADPVFQAGGIAGLRQMGAVIDGGNEMAGIGLAISALTRPMDFFAEVQDADKALALLDKTAFSLDSWMKVRRITRESDSRRIYAVDIGGLAQLHLAVSLEHGWLHVTNHPWSGTLTVTGTEPEARGSACVRISPAELKAGNPAAVFQAQNDRRRRVFAAAAELLPWMETLGLSAAAAQEQQFAALGLCTPLPAGVNVTALDPLTIPGVIGENGEILSAAEAAADPGVLAGIQSVELFTSLEEDGLRASLEWKIAP